MAAPLSSKSMATPYDHALIAARCGTDAYVRELMARRLLMFPHGNCLSIQDWLAKGMASQESS